jgi:hypothetical protein
MPKAAKFINAKLNDKPAAFLASLCDKNAEDITSWLDRHVLVRIKPVVRTWSGVSMLAVRDWYHNAEMHNADM